MLPGPDTFVIFQFQKYLNIFKMKGEKIILAKLLAIIIELDILYATHVILSDISN